MEMREYSRIKLIPINFISKIEVYIMREYILLGHSVVVGGK